VVLLYYTDGANRGGDGRGGPSADSLVHHGGSDMSHRGANVNSQNSNEVEVDAGHHRGGAGNDKVSKALSVIGLVWLRFIIPRINSKCISFCSLVVVAHVLGVLFG